ncbi:unnamed protein product, partial [Prorocentrum cordatum]
MKKKSERRTGRRRTSGGGGGGGAGERGRRGSGGSSDQGRQGRMLKAPPAPRLSTGSHRPCAERREGGNGGGSRDKEDKRGAAPTKLPDSAAAQRQARQAGRRPAGGSSIQNSTGPTPREKHTCGSAARAATPGNPAAASSGSASSSSSTAGCTSRARTLLHGKDLREPAGPGGCLGRRGPLRAFQNSLGGVERSRGRGQGGRGRRGRGSRRGRR